MPVRIFGVGSNKAKPCHPPLFSMHGRSAGNERDEIEAWHGIITIFDIRVINVKSHYWCRMTSCLIQIQWWLLGRKWNEWSISWFMEKCIHAIHANWCLYRCNNGLCWCFYLYLCIKNMINKVTYDLVSVKLVTHLCRWHGKLTETFQSVSSILSTKYFIPNKLHQDQSLVLFYFSKRLHA